MLQPVRRKSVAVVFGTRPEAVKLAPVVHAMRERHPEIDTRVIVTGQHRQMLDQAMEVFRLKADHDLNIMQPGQTLGDIICRSLTAMDAALAELAPDMVVVQGDTSTTFAGALAAFYRKIPVAHVEAGLRTGNKYSPFPEEMNRRLTGCVADIHFPPTEGSRRNLLAEGIDDRTIEITGNTAIDALKWVLANRECDLRAALGDAAPALDSPRMILMTSHRRENFGEPMRNAFRAIAESVRDMPDVALVFPVHPNPNVRKEVATAFAGASRVFLIDPLDYVGFSHLLRRCHLVLTDSGGVQEEAPSLGKPVLVMRDTTERPEGIDAGSARLVGTDPVKIKDSIRELLTDSAAYARMSTPANPYGDGTASPRIADRIAKHLALHAGKSPA